MKLTAEVKSIVTDEKYLANRAQEIDPRKDGEKMRQIVGDLKKTMRENPDIVALSAPQIGYMYRIFCIKFDVEIKTFINPIITNAKGLELSKETCHSIPGKTFIRPRNNDINVMYTQPDGKLQGKQLLGKAAIVFQHQIDHLDGLLLEDVGLEIDEDYDNASDEEKEEIIKMYLDSLDMFSKDINKQIEDDPELQQIKEASRFLEAVQKGEVEIEKEELSEEQVNLINQAKREVRAELGENS